MIHRITVTLATLALVTSIASPVQVAAQEPSLLLAGTITASVGNVA